ncbi:MAG: Phosphoserine phosphatase [uncultured Rubrobacteraceae bacterium]|uniref:Phosphoserine phosphatase n=1 Tax=uncultured Rubrobacteraceae bacterium TaxID=349277 RepID=A0A6J4PRP5_9ACTN|nr:MAG: Phosphoserine phosphatase [uncultured Rubrobacteraceae bacterium]
MLAESYRDKTILLTGGTGFLGTALVEKILRSLPDLGRLYLVVRPSKDKGADERFNKDVLGSAAFRRLREELGDEFDGRVAEKVRVLEGDVHAPSLGLGEGDLAELSENVDVVVHSAASVVFDAPLDAAVDSNVRGTVGLLKLARGWSKRPLFMHISTAYVAGNIKGAAPEEPPGRTTPNGTVLDAREEILGLDAVVGEVEKGSQERGLLRRFETEARNELGMVGEEEEVAARVDQLRRAWMRERLVERGTERARELGWNDVYTFTKSLAERTVVAERGESPLVILRPAIIESSFREPYAGWIQGSRMADPIIMAYAKGLLREFPGDPETLVDIVPVDHVVNAILAAGVRRPREPEVFHVASGQRNPLRYRDLYDHVRDYFVENPLRDSGGRPVQVPEWSFPGRGKVELALKAQLTALKAGGKVAAQLPDGHMVSDARQRMARAEKRARMSLYYSRIYGAYANMYAVFSTDRTKALYEALEPEDKRLFPFDIAEVRWREWLHGTHLPALTTRPNRKRRRKVEERPGEVAAIFDVDGTLVGSNVVSYYAWLRMQELPAPVRPLWLAAFLTKIPYYWGLDKVSRAHFNRVFYKNYAGWTPERARHLGRESFAGFTLERIFPEALDRLREHKALGHRVVLLSGALDFLLEPMKDLADDVLCSTLAQEDGTFTGELSGSPVAGDARARMLASFARKRNVDLSRSYAYADAISDLPMLEAVGRPVAVNPDRRLRAAAEERGWQIRDWGRDRVAKKV